MRLSLVMLPLAIAAAPALAQPLPPPPPPMGGWREAPPPPPEFREQGDWNNGEADRARADWLADCRHRMGARRDDGTSGALVGAAVGGVVGNVVAGRGDKLGGTLIGAGAGAVAGLAIDRAVSADRRGDYCEAWFERHSGGAGYARPRYGYPQAAYGYAYQPMMVMVPVAAPMMMMVQQPAPARRECREVVTYDTVVDYVPGPARRVIPPRARPQYKRAPDKRVRIAPDKRIPAS